MEHVKDHNADVVFLTETWQTSLKNKVTAAVKNYGYELKHSVRQHDTKSRGGGVGLLCKCNIDVKVKKLKLPKFHACEYAVYSVSSESKGRKNNLLLVPVYRDQYISFDTFVDEFTQLLQSILLTNCSVVISGDFNVHWGSNSTDANTLSDLLESFNLIQHVNKPTNAFNNILDLVISNEYGNGGSLCRVNLTDIDVNNVSLSDHFLVSYKVGFGNLSKKTKTVYHRHLKSLDHVAFRNDLASLLCEYKKSVFGRSFSVKCQVFHEALSALIESHAPLKKKVVKIVPSSSTWFNHEYVLLRRKRRKAEKVSKQTGLTVDRENFIKLRKDTTLLAKSLKYNSIKRDIANTNGDQKQLYNMFNRLVDNGSEVILPEHESDEELANRFSEYFQQKVTNIRDSFTPCNTVIESEQFSGAFLSTFEKTSVSELSSIVQDHGIKCSTADDFPGTFVSDNIDLFLPVWVDLINTSFEEGSFEGLKLAFIKPTLKDYKLDHEALKSFRPVSNLVFLSKLMERVVLKRLHNHMEKNNLVIPNQSGYKKGHSTETLLVRITNDLLIASDKNTGTVLLLLDLSAAFDTVDVNKLLDILFVEIGIRGLALDWFKSFLIGRTCRVKIGNSYSEEVILEFGVPQGSVLGPVLFNIYIRSFYRYVNRNSLFTTHGFADDHQLYCSFSVHNQVFMLGQNITDLLANVKLWMNIFFVKLNESKTNIIVFAPKRIEKEISINGLFIDNECIRFSNVVENLGVLLDSKLSFRQHITKCTQSCYMSIKKISSVKSFLDTNQRIVLVTALVLSQLDYCNGLLYNIDNTLLKQLQKVENCAAKLIFNRRKYDTGLSSLYSTLHWLHIKERIVFKILLLVHKCIYYKAPIYLTQKTRYATSDGAFSVCAPYLWNALPTVLKLECSTVQFKRKLKEHLFEC